MLLLLLPLLGCAYSLGWSRRRLASLLRLVTPLLFWNGKGQRAADAVEAVGACSTIQTLQWALVAQVADLETKKDRENQIKGVGGCCVFAEGASKRNNIVI